MLKSFPECKSGSPRHGVRGEVWFHAVRNESSHFKNTSKHKPTARCQLNPHCSQTGTQASSMPTADPQHSTHLPSVPHETCLSSILNLGDVEETLLIPLYMRALETARPDSIIHDPKSVEIVGQLDYDFEKFAGAWMQQIEVAVRTEIIDEQVGKFLRAQPDATVVNLGAGLDSRYLRLDNRQVRWYELDTPPVIDLRRRFYQETDRNRFIGKSMFDDAWYEEIGVTTGRDVMLIAEGLLPYFSPHQVRELLKTIADRLPQAKLLFQSISPFYVNSQQRVAGLNQTRGVLRWGIRRAS